MSYDALEQQGSGAQPYELFLFQGTGISFALTSADETQIRLVNEGGGVERVPGRLVGQPLRGEAAQLLVNQGQQLRRGPGVAMSDGIEDARDIIHGVFGIFPLHSRLTCQDSRRLRPRRTMGVKARDDVDASRCSSRPASICFTSSGCTQHGFPASDRWNGF